ncbi:hypothetical protein N802_18370 [Knoellia sinensis KCTC 19936]|uniref:LysM domain-containing protein n=1 Tax=Knoellia sinensis KCTC 19936 TaxID=1385520 RepID=A0A0A0J4Q5_9MICO|nr:LysM peptidoglycan-binding domain-containing protein [Knoellia sinensis]KGN32330.1 hypothetical protein N802_18370 [Knoellia sinensis KCTC 19936]
MQTAANSIKLHSKASSATVAGRLLVTSLLAAVVVGAATWLLAVAWLWAHARVTAAGPAAVDEVLALALATLAAAVGAWLFVGVALEVLSHAPGRLGLLAGHCADRLTPALARRVAAFILGVGIGVAGGPTQAVAAPRSTVASATDSPGGVTVVADPGFVPTRGTAPEAGFESLTRPATRAATSQKPSPAPAPGFTPSAPRVRPQADPGLLGSRPSNAPELEVVVHRGDSLWSIAARHLGPDATDAEIARSWPLWFETNRDRIGDDPDVILPGQILRIPSPEQTASVTR